MAVKNIHAITVQPAPHHKVIDMDTEELRRKIEELAYDCPQLNDLMRLHKLGLCTWEEMLMSYALNLKHNQDILKSKLYKALYSAPPTITLSDEQYAHYIQHIRSKQPTQGHHQG